jgi:PAS domain S-box-containing protein
MTDALGDDSVKAGTDGVIRHWPPTWESVLGYTEGDAVGRPVDLVVPHALRRLHWRGFNKAIASGRLKRDGKAFNTVGLHKSGKFVALRAVLELTRDEDGTVDGAKGTYRGPGPRWLAWISFPVLRLGQVLSRSGRSS